MLPIQLITGLFTATIVGATGAFVRLEAYTPIAWFMYLYLISYRIKVFLDDIVYYQKMKKYAVGGGDPIIGLITWLIWITTAILIGNEVAYFGLTSLTFGIGVIWVTIAKHNVSTRARETSNSMKVIIEQISSAHSKWWRFNLIPFVIAGTYFIFYMTDININWKNLWFWIGPVLMIGSLIWDIITDYRFMFQLDMPTEKEDGNST